MKISTLTYFCLIASLLIACSRIEQSEKQFNGHWHSTIPDLQYFKTLDVYDSAALVDKYSIVYPRLSSFPRRNTITNKYFLPSYEGEFSEYYFIENDTLKIVQQGDTLKYVRSNVNQCELHDRYPSSLIAIDISLPEASSSLDYDDLSFCSNLIIGSQLNQLSRIKLNKDSAFIQGDDMFLHLKDMQRWCREKKSILLANESVKLVLHVDKSVNGDFMNRMMQTIPSDFLLYKAVNTNGHLGVIEITRNK
jgi:hypothetical protein